MEASIRSMQSDNHVIPLDELGCAPVAFRKECPTGPSATDSVFNGVWGVMNKVEAVKAEAKRVGADQYLSDEGRANKVRATWGGVREALKQLEGTLIAEGSQVDDIERTLFSVPRIEPTDAVTALADREIREWFGTLDASTRAKYANEMIAGERRELLVALVRSPIPTPYEHVAKTAWRACVERAEPQKVAGLAKRRERLEWARAAKRSVDGRLAEWTHKNAQPRAA